MVNHPNHFERSHFEIVLFRDQHYMQTAPQSRMKNPTNHT